MDVNEIILMINTYNDYVGKIISALEHFRDNLSVYTYHDLSSTIAAVNNGLIWIDQANLNFVKLGYLKVEKYRQFIALVKVFQEALEHQDYILLHDFLEYDLIPFLKEMNLIGVIEV